MTYENCVLYAKQYEAEGNKEMAKFWKERIKRKYGKVEEEVEEVEEVKEQNNKKKGNK